MRKLFALELCARQNSSPYSFYHTSRYRKTTGMRGPFGFVNSTYPKTQSDSGSLLRFVIVTLILRLFLAQLFFTTVSLIILIAFRIFYNEIHRPIVSERKLSKDWVRGFYGLFLHNKSVKLPTPSSNLATQTLSKPVSSLRHSLFEVCF